MFHAFYGVLRLCSFKQLNKMHMNIKSTIMESNYECDTYLSLEG